MDKKIIGLMGFSGVGKDTAADILIEKHGYKKVAFADSLKDVVSAVFKWPRDLLEGKGKESREWRNKVDEYWSKELGFVITPRIALEKIGTDLFREHFDPNIWTLSTKKDIIISSQDIIITDVRFQEEASLIKSLGGTLISIEKTKLPTWYNDALEVIAGKKSEVVGVHKSQYLWLGFKKDYTIVNDGKIEDLQELLVECMMNIPIYQNIT